MSNLKELIERYTIKKDRLIKKICLPLQQLEISVFGYFKIEPNGEFGTFSNYPEQLDYYYCEKLYKTTPYFNHPQLSRSGYSFLTTAQDPIYVAKIFELFQVHSLLLMLKHSGESLEGFFFAKKGADADKYQDFYPKLHLFNAFICYFKQEAHTLIESMMKDKFNLKEAKGKAFFEIDPSLPLAKLNKQVEKFSKLVCPLSHREQQCLALFKQGHSAQATGAILGLSKRTVEHYYDNIKMKLNCDSKWDLLKW